ncbi:MAG: extracellular solute-binding protein [Deltaproteobacteria bacterium]|nr:extracellular solute-binding protein [Deltaproteobacteria bacterium]
MQAEKDDNTAQGPLRRWLDDMPLGLAPLLIACMGLIAGLYLLVNPVRGGHADLSMWVFGPLHADAYQTAADGFAKMTGRTVDVQLINYNAVNQKLRSALWAAVNIPDLVEIEKSAAGGFFRGPLDKVGFLDLKPFLERDGILDRIPANALAAYTDRGAIFGVPHDIHPVMLAYRADIVDSYLARRGLRMADLATWDDYFRELHDLLVPDQRYLLQIEYGDAWAFQIFLMQRGGGIFGPRGELRMDDEVAVGTMTWMIPLVAEAEGRKVAESLGNWDPSFYRGFIEGFYIAALCPDWRTSQLEAFAGELSGKLRLVPLPAPAPGGLRTSQMGGTMLGIARSAKDPGLAWQFARQIYYGSPTQHGRLFRITNILTPDRRAWGDPAYHEARPYWGNQVLGEQFIALADEVPPFYSSGFLPVAQAKLNEAIVACYSQYRSHGAEGFEAFVRQRLKSAADHVRRQMQREPDWDAGR